MNPTDKLKKIMVGALLSSGVALAGMSLSASPASAASVPYEFKTKGDHFEWGGETGGPRSPEAILGHLGLVPPGRELPVGCGSNHSECNDGRSS